MSEKWQWSNDDAAKAIGLDLVGQFGKLGVIPELLPASEMLFVPGLKVKLHTLEG